MYMYCYRDGNIVTFSQISKFVFIKMFPLLLSYLPYLTLPFLFSSWNTALVWLSLETQIFILNFLLFSSSSQMGEAHTNEIKHDIHLE